MLTDFCNECGNCVTFCPTSGEPYRDKPRLYLDRAVELASQIGDENLARWSALLSLGAAAQDPARLVAAGAL